MKAIDLFAGAGGFTDGATRAGASVLWAANHWPVAVETHGRNHPETIHACQDLTQADFTAVPDDGYSCADCGDTDADALELFDAGVDCIWLLCRECSYQVRCESGQASQNDDTYGRE